MLLIVGVSAGHYTAYTQHPRTGEWHYYNDDFVYLLDTTLPTLSIHGLESGTITMTILLVNSHPRTTTIAHVYLLDTTLPTLSIHGLESGTITMMILLVNSHPRTTTIAHVVDCRCICWTLHCLHSASTDWRVALLQ
ncbi:hypothetical protein J6590_032136 [Homalodisca vitripennis]|nr:hypothetical protein J6590_032136 [Homalodisca vitripennis]